MADCTKCANRNNDYCIFACENGESFKPITNADRIRSMTDEKLAEWLNHMQGDAYDRGMLEDWIVRYPNNYAAWLDWLRAEVET